MLPGEVWVLVCKTAHRHKCIDELIGGGLAGCQAPKKMADRNREAELQRLLLPALRSTTAKKSVHGEYYFEFMRELLWLGVEMGFPCRAIALRYTPQWASLIGCCTAVQVGGVTVGRVCCLAVLPCRK